MSGASAKPTPRAATPARPRRPPTTAVVVCRSAAIGATNRLIATRGSVPTKDVRSSGQMVAASDRLPSEVSAKSGSTYTRRATRTRRPVVTASSPRAITALISRTRQGCRDG